MADQAPHDWQLLSRICNSLGRHDHPLYRALAHADYPKEYRLLALESALRSGGIPMRGSRMTAFGLEAPEHIETKIDADTAIEITLNEVTLRNRYGDEELSEVAVFKRVQADLPSVERLLSRSTLKARPLLAVTDDEITDFVKVAGCSNVNTAWLSVKDKLPGVKQDRFRELWNKGSFGGPRGRPANCVKK
ncbi:MAG TPA: hypothetical protein VGP28_00835 [Methylocella sp.]|jgi:hypothetical protein|nr:hypothetical protein [Methylocella sp.]